MVFDPAEMLGLAGALGNAAGDLQEAATKLRSAVGGAGDLPPGVLAAVRAETASASRLLAAAADTYEAGSREVRRQAERARAAGEEAGSWVPLSAGTGGKILKHGSAIVLEVDKYLNGGRVQQGAKSVMAAKLFADLSGNKALQTVLKFDDWRAAYRDARVRPGDTALTRLRKTYQRRLRDGIATNLNSIRIGHQPDTGRSVPGLSQGSDGLRPANRGLKRLSGTLAGAAPFAGFAADGLMLAADVKAVRDRATPRNILAVTAAGCMSPPTPCRRPPSGHQAVLTAPAAVLVDGAATVGDIGVLAIDSAPVLARAAQGPVINLGQKALGGLGSVLPKFP